MACHMQNPKSKISSGFNNLLSEDHEVYEGELSIYDRDDKNCLSEMFSILHSGSKIFAVSF